MNPFAEAYSLFAACATPLLIALFGTLVLGILAGWSLRPAQQELPAEVAADNLALESRLKTAEEKVNATTTELTRMRVRFTEEREQLERTLGAKQAEVQATKEALVAAQRRAPAPTEVVKVVPDPKHIARIAGLERDNARIPALMEELEGLRNALAKEVADREKAKKRKKEKKQRKKMLKTVVQLETLTKTAAADDLRAISATLGRKVKRDDLQLVDGIGPKIKAQLMKNGYKTWSDVAAAKPEQLKKALAKAGEHYRAYDPTTWPEQARMMQENRWEELKKYQRKLSKVR